MSFVRRAALLTVGAAAGVSSAPYWYSSPNGAVVHTTETPAHPLFSSAGQPRRECGSWRDSTAAAETPRGTLEDADISFSELLLQRFTELAKAASLRAADLRAVLFGSPHQAAFAASSESAVGEPGTSAAAVGVDTTPFRNVPHQLKDRFLRYAQRDAETGEFVLSLDDFVRCMLLLPKLETDDGVPAHAAHHTHDLIDSAAAAPLLRGNPAEQQSSSAWLRQVPPAVRRRLVHFFHCVDLDGTNTVGYAEFVVLFTFLSVRRPTLERAFHVFDLDDNGRLSEAEFCRLLNTIMVDPAVQVTFTQPPPSAGLNGREKGVRAGQGSPSAPVSVASRAGESRSSERERQRHKDELSFELPSALMRPLLFGALPLHVGAPPGSTHYVEVSPQPAATTAYVTAATAGAAASCPPSAAATSNKEGKNASVATTSAPLNSSSSKSSWWAHVCQLWFQVWGREGGALPSSSLSLAPPSRVAELQQMAEQDALLQTVSYPTFLYRMDYLRWELRAIEFGLFDPDNKGAITLQDCRVLLGRDRRPLPGTPATKTTAHTTPEGEGAAEDETTPNAGAAAASRLAPTTTVTWQVYQKLFDIIKESNTILPALQLMLDSLPPVPEDVLRGGAIPDTELDAATQAVKAVVQQTVQRYNTHSGSSSKGAEASAGAEKSNPAKAEATSDDRATDAAAAHHKETSAERKEGTATADARELSSSPRALSPPAEATEQERYNEERFGLISDPSKTAKENRVKARRLQASLVRPTALTWKQFSQVLAAVGTVPRLSKKEEALFRALLDDDNSNSLTPEEFAQLCTMKETFFATQLPRFDEPKRNVVQQFFFCMQQLD